MKPLSRNGLRRKMSLACSHRSINLQDRTTGRVTLLKRFTKRFRTCAPMKILRQTSNACFNAVHYTHETYKSCVRWGIAGGGPEGPWHKDLLRNRQPSIG